MTATLLVWISHARLYISAHAVTVYGLTTQLHLHLCSMVTRVLISLEAGEVVPETLTLHLQKCKRQTR